MATLSSAGRIRVEEVICEIERLQKLWHATEENGHISILEKLMPPADIEEIDLFDQVQLASVIKLCSTGNSLSAAGRKLISNTLSRKKAANDADMLSKYLARFGLNWAMLKKNFQISNFKRHLESGQWRYCV